MSILEMTLTGGVMVLVITVLRAVLLNKLPKKTFVFLWEIAMLRLVLPISIPAVTSVYSLFSLFGNSVTTSQTVPETTATNITMISNSIIEENLQSRAPISICAIVWLVGMAITSAVFVLGYIIIYRRYRYAANVKGGYIEELLLKQKIRRNVRIRYSEQAVSPLTYGILRPTIILPENLENKQSEQRMLYYFVHNDNIYEMSNKPSVLASRKFSNVTI